MPTRVSIIRSHLLDSKDLILEETMLRSQNENADSDEPILLVFL